MEKRKGFLLVGVVLLLALLLIVVPVMVKWVQQDTKMSVKDQKSNAAFSLAEAAVDRGYWKVKGSTTPFALVSAGSTLTGYNFDVSYNDISGGKYRIDITSGPLDTQFTVYGEGKDNVTGQTRALKVVYTNGSVPGPILSGQNLTIDGGSDTHWGPIMAKGNITLLDRTAAGKYYPRKLAQGVVQTASGVTPARDTNGTTPPNYSIPREQSDWESNYNVPDLPDFDFETMRSSAAQTGTLGCQDVNINTVAPSTWAIRSCYGAGCTGTSGTGKTFITSGSPKECWGVNCSSNSTCVCYTMKCCKSTTLGGAVTCPYTTTSAEDAAKDGSHNAVISNLFMQTDASGALLRDKDYTWYWGGNANWFGYTGTKGTIIARGDLQISSYPTGAYDDRYCRTGTTGSSGSCTLPVPSNAWKEYQHPVNSWPARTGATSNAATYLLNDATSSGSGGDLGVYGFLYIGGNFNRYGAADVYGAIWVSSSTSGTGNTMVFYNSKLKVPTLNVVFTRDSWEETAPSSQAWP